MIGIVEYGAGNQTSVRRALAHLGIEAVISADPRVLRSCAGLIFPGVGAAPQAMERLRVSGMDELLRDAVQIRIPLLGICLGCQILVEKSAEGPVSTLGLFPGECVRFDPELTEEDGSPIRIPHMGWNRLVIVQRSPLLAGLRGDEEFYFVHGYYVRTQPQWVIAESYYGTRFCAVYGYDGLWAVQFHPEKSGRPGLKILENFCFWCTEKGGAIQKADCLS